MLAFAASGRRENGGRWSWISLIPVVLVILLWLTDIVRPDFLLKQVPEVAHWSFLETSWSYAYLHIFTFMPVFLLSFDRNVHYYTRWKYLFPAILIVGLIFILWDVFFTVKGVWGFNESYLLGVSFLHLPVEEWLFFVTVPFACVFIYECLNYYVRKDILLSVEGWITPVLIILFLVTGILYWGHMYTATTFLLSGAFLLFHFLVWKNTYRSRFYLAYLVSLLPFLLVNGVLTGGYTSEPIVIYNPEEYLGIRVTSVPLDDAIYGFLLLLGVITLYEYFSEKKIW